MPDGPPFPELLDYLWEWFNEILLGLEQNGMGPVTVSWQSLECWCSQMRVEIEPWEARALVWLGTIRANIQSEKSRAAAKKKSEVP